MSNMHAVSDVAPPNWIAGRFEAQPKFSVLFVSGLVGAAMPLILALYWVAFGLAPESMGLPLRISMLGCALLLAGIWYRAPLSHAEVSLFRVLGLAAILWLIATLTATNRAHAFAGWIKMLLLFAICGCVARGLRHPSTARAFGLALLAGGIILAAFILLTYVRYLGFTMPTYKTARQFKGMAEMGGLPLNPIAFDAVFSYLAGLCLLPRSRPLILIGLPLFAICSVFTGSRAPLVILGASVFVLLCIHGLRNKSLLLRAGTALIAAIAAVGGSAVVLLAPDKEISAATEGRSHLWAVGLQKFSERPLFGWGYESWRDDLVSRLPGEYDLTFDLAKNMGGGYHNEYVSVFAEEGLIGAFAALLIICLLFRSSWLLTFRKWGASQSYDWPLFVCIFLLLRANFEVPGLFGYAQGPDDYLAYIFVAIVLSRFSVEEDYARRLTRAGAVGVS